eukprot:CAMPEP_0177541106 /NCGR_PEP_ID=MMETSP0369-20130122/59985_1 /TAXON_ID=447022 ORGANISM="Scrippsiella hangoei-like, Strain SHHI-4" /NCGR_SAMPLE_ID=MMETSP0369 /ASSEMBLY_ACC=CAM_ASM_000364 /LENGTH=140 /DNA_ID=CAMNT_0019024465 /DNA_START=1 /DNA_END=420 /DNA_ORIENTATION=+
MDIGPRGLRVHLAARLVVHANLRSALELEAWQTQARCIAARCEMGDGLVSCWFLRARPSDSELGSPGLPHVEAPSDAVCRRSEGTAAWMSLLETTAECEFLLLALNSYAAAAALSFFAAALGLAGLTLERRRLEERWPCL